MSIALGDELTPRSPERLRRNSVHKVPDAESFEHPAQDIQEKIEAIEDAVQRLRRLDEQLSAVVSTWSMDAGRRGLSGDARVPCSWSQ